MFMQLDTQAAKQADQTGKFIKETGKYVGKFTKAEVLKAATGTTGISFTFESNEGQSVNFAIYIYKADGEKLHAFKTLNSIAVCLKLRAIADPVTGTATKYDFDQKKDVQYQAPLLLDLMNKKIGIVLQSCEYAKEKDRVPTGEYGWKLELQGAFDAETELTAGEILDRKTKPEVLEQIISRLADRPLKSKGATTTRGSSQSSNSSSMPDNFDDLDIPF
jgi:hypothetical protein